MLIGFCTKSLVANVVKVVFLETVGIGWHYTGKIRRRDDELLSKLRLNLNISWKRQTDFCAKKIGFYRRRTMSGCNVQFPPFESVPGLGVGAL